MDLSIIIPVWNEQIKIAQDMIWAFRFIQSLGAEGEIIVADDGSTDQTAEIAGRTACETGKNTRILRLSHQGKGSAVRNGILNSSGDVVLFMDSGGCVNFSDVSRGIFMVQHGNCDMALGSRYLFKSRVVHHSGIRRMSSRFFRTFIKYIHIVPMQITDTQCGLKIFKGSVARRIFNSSAIRGFLFDIETLLIALYSGYRVREFPVHWKTDRDSRFSIYRFPQILMELAAVLFKFYWIPHRLKLPKTQGSVRDCS